MQYLVMHRVQPSTQRGYLLVAHTAYPSSRGSKDRGFSTSLFLYGVSYAYSDRDS